MRSMGSSERRVRSVSSCSLRTLGVLSDPSDCNKEMFLVTKDTTDSQRTLRFMLKGTGKIVSTSLRRDN